MKKKLFIQLQNDNSRLENKTMVNGKATFSVVMAGSNIHTFQNWEFGELLPEHIRHKKEIKINYSQKAYSDCNFDYIPITANHPWILLQEMRGEEKTGLILGMTGKSTINKDGNVQADVTITDGELISKIVENQTDVSWGGLGEIEWASEDENNPDFDGVIKNIQVDHLAILTDGVGRCGEDCRIKSVENARKETLELVSSFKKTPPKKENIINIDNNTNNKGSNKMTKIIINGTSFEVESDIADAINNAVGAKDGEIVALNKKVDELKVDAEKYQTLQRKTYFDQIANMAKDLDPNFEINEKDTIISIANSIMGSDLTNEISAVASLKAYHGAVLKDQKQDVIVQNKAEKEIKSASDAIEDVYASMFS